MDRYRFDGKEFSSLPKVAEYIEKGRGLGFYTAEGLPARGSAEGAGSKRVAIMDLNALISHNANHVLQDAKLIRGQKNPEFWAAHMSGHKPPTPPVPHVYHKFIKVAGRRRGSGFFDVVRVEHAQHVGCVGEREGCRFFRNRGSVLPLVIGAGCVVGLDH
jgi:hypothetical protein